MHVRAKSAPDFTPATRTTICTFCWWGCWTWWWDCEERSSASIKASLFALDRERKSASAEKTQRAEQSGHRAAHLELLQPCLFAKKLRHSSSRYKAMEPQESSTPTPTHAHGLTHTPTTLPPSHTHIHTHTVF